MRLIAKSTMLLICGFHAILLISLIFTKSEFCLVTLLASCLSCVIFRILSNVLRAFVWSNFASVVIGATGYSPNISGINSIIMPILAVFIVTYLNSLYNCCITKTLTIDFVCYMKYFLLSLFVGIVIGAILFLIRVSYTQSPFIREGITDSSSIFYLTVIVGISVGNALALCRCQNVAP